MKSKSTNPHAHLKLRDPSEAKVQQAIKDEFGCMVTRVKEQQAINIGDSTVVIMEAKDGYAKLSIRARKSLTIQKPLP